MSEAHGVSRRIGCNGSAPWANSMSTAAAFSHLMAQDNGDRIRHMSSLAFSNPSGQKRAFAEPHPSCNRYFPIEQARCEQVPTANKSGVVNVGLNVYENIWRDDVDVVVLVWCWWWW